MISIIKDMKSDGVGISINMKKILLLAILNCLLASVHGQTQKKKLPINYFTLASIFVRTYNGDSVAGSATAFIVEYKKKHYLLTNWHVVTNREYYKAGRPLHKSGVPTKLAVYYNSDTILKYNPKWVPLYQEGKPKWLTFLYKNTSGKIDTADVVALEIKPDINTKFYPIKADSAFSFLDDEPFIEPMTELFIVGFPDGMRSYKYAPVYKRGTVASEPMIAYNGRPSFLIDATGKPGISGSPVYFYTKSEYLTWDGTMVKPAGPFWVCVGIYAAQDTGAEIGEVITIGYIIQELKRLVN